MIKMNAKNLMVFFLALASVLLIAGNIAAMEEIATIDIVQVDGVSALGDEVAVIAGETITVKVFFTALQTAADVKVKLELEGQKLDVEAVTQSFNIEKDKKYAKTLTLRIPYELKNEASDDTTLDIKIWNGDFKTEDDSIALRVQRPSYNANIMSIDSSQTVEAGQLYPVDIVIKNTGYNALDDLYVTLGISALGIEKESYFGDLVAVDNDDDDTETRRFYLQIPFDAEEGLYTLEVEASNADLSVSGAKQIAIENEFSSAIIVDSLRKSGSVGDETEFELIVANPTNNLRVFRIVTESSGDLDTDANVELVSVPAGTTKTVSVTAEPSKKGEYNFDVSVFAGEELVDSVTLTVYASGRSASNSTAALTIILIIILLVLAGVLFMLLRKKPEKSEEIGESYY